MSELSNLNPTGRFSGLADVYARHRPDYPDAAVDFVLAHCGLGPGAVLADIGSGTGISSRQLAGRGLRVIGVEPNAEMRGKAEAASSGADAPIYRHGSAEATGLPADSCDAVLAAQAFHWFASEKALHEFRRILKPNGWVVLLWNERDESDPFTAAFGDVIRTAKDAGSLEKSRSKCADVLLATPLFRNGCRERFVHEQALGEDGLLGRAFSMSYAPREPAKAAPFAAALRSVFARFQKDGQVLLRYVTTVTAAQK